MANTLSSLHSIKWGTGMISHHEHRGQLANSQPNFVGLYCVIEVLPNHIYKVEHSQQV